MRIKYGAFAVAIVLAAYFLVIPSSVTTHTDSTPVWRGRRITASNRATYRTHPSLPYVSSSASVWQGSFDFIQLADPQIGMLAMDSDWLAELRLLRKAIDHANRLRPRFVLFSGDLINAYPTTDKAERAGQQTEDLLAALAHLDGTIPMLLTPGNHDLGAGAAAHVVQLYHKRFGDDYLEAWVGNVLFLAVNSQFYMRSSSLSGTRADNTLWNEHDHWLTTALTSQRAKQAKHIIMLSHIPPFVSRFDEAHGWGNWPLAPRKRIVSAAAKAGSSLWLSGHLHQNAESHGGGISVVTSSSCGSIINWTSPLEEVASTVSLGDGVFSKLTGVPAVAADEGLAGLRIVRVEEHKVSHRWYSLNKVPETIDAAFLPQAADYL